MNTIRQHGLGRTLFLAVLVAFTLIGTASAKSICNQCKGTGKILEVTKQCPLHQPLAGHCLNCDGSGLVGPPCPYCNGIGYILTPAEKEAEKKARAAADARARAEGEELRAKRAREDSIAAVERTNKEADLRARGITNRREAIYIQRTIMQNMGALRYAYKERRRERPGLAEGNITIKFEINGAGKVISALLVESALNDPLFETTLISKIKSWDFGKIPDTSDVTEVTYPFNFANY